MTQADFRWATLMMRHPRGVLRVLRIGLRWIWAMLTRKDLVVRGQAFAGALRVGLREAGVPVLLDTALEELHGRARPGHRRRRHARRAAAR